MEARLMQSTKADHSMEVTLLGIFIKVKLLHPRKAQMLMKVTELGIVTDDSLLHPSKAEPPMDCSPSFNVSEVR